MRVHCTQLAVVMETSTTAISSYTERKWRWKWLHFKQIQKYCNFWHRPSRSKFTLKVDSFYRRKFVRYNRALADLGGAWGTHAPPWASKFFRFHAVFGKIWRVHAPPGGFTPPLGKILDPPLPGVRYNRSRCKQGPVCYCWKFTTFWDRSWKIKNNWKSQDHTTTKKIRDKKLNEHHFLDFWNYEYPNRAKYCKQASAINGWLSVSVVKLSFHILFVKRYLGFSYLFEWIFHSLRLVKGNLKKWNVVPYKVQVIYMFKKFKCAVIKRSKFWCFVTVDQYFSVYFWL